MKDRWVFAIGLAGIAAALALQVWTARHPFRPAGAPPWAAPLVERDLRVIERDTLRVLVLRDPLSYEPGNGAPGGLEHDLLARYASWAGLPMVPVPVDHPDTMLLWLQQGRGDVIAAQRAPEGPWREHIAFTAPYQQVAPLLVRLRPDPLVPSTRRPVDTVVVSRWSPFAFRRLNVDSALVDGAVLLRDTTGPEDVLVAVALGRRQAAVVSEACAVSEAQRFPHLSFGPRVGAPVDLAFGVRSNAPRLLRSLNAWLADPGERIFVNERIGAVEGSVKQRGALGGGRVSPLGTDTISPFDSLFQLHADSLSLDWRLLAAVAFKESRFDTAAVSSQGAGGLMQMMPGTAEALGVDARDGVSGQVRGASRYLAELDTLWRGSVPAEDQRLKFVLASYNAGPGHIKDAQKLARELGLDPQRWDGEVERALLLLNKPRFNQLPFVRNGSCKGWQTFLYVREVGSTFRRFRGTK
jgi:membrane-bound lytic murein transglycosylase F